MLLTTGTLTQLHINALQDNGENWRLLREGGSRWRYVGWAKPNARTAYLASRSRFQWGLPLSMRGKGCSPADWIVVSSICRRTLLLVITVGAMGVFRPEAARLSTKREIFEEDGGPLTMSREVVHPASLDEGICVGMPKRGIIESKFEMFLVRV
ncbi:hypothetical protein DL96DRAFT_1630983 [Flagelloscypha sp. PMI_526]|nr:hypothetical protein DL96DRAFT_1630983 [Flagelloscypha sp. PMI_526]